MRQQPASLPFIRALGRVVRTALICCNDFEPKDLFEPISVRQTCETDVVQGFELCPCRIS